MIKYDGKIFSLAGNPVMANYEMEERAARLLYESGQRFSLPKKSDHDALARYMGASVRYEYLSDSPYCLCAVALEGQTLRTQNGKALVMSAGDIIVEKSLVDSGKTGWRDYAVFHALSHLYLHCRDGALTGQLSFDLTGTQSLRHYICGSGELADVLSDERLDSRDESEAQADAFAGALMLPKVVFKFAANRFMSEAGINRADLKGETVGKMTAALAEIFSAPEIIVALRLKKLLYL